MKRNKIIALGIVATIVETAAWHGPLGAADRLSSKIERTSRATLDHYEMTRVSARLDRDPLRRRLALTGPADDFQRSELIRIMDEVPAVAAVRWATPSIPSDVAK